MTPYGVTMPQYVERASYVSQGGIQTRLHIHPQWQNGCRGILYTLMYKKWLPMAERWVRFWEIRLPSHRGFPGLVHCPLEYLTVSLHSPNGRQCACRWGCSRDCQCPLKWREFLLVTRAHNAGQLTQNAMTPVICRPCLISYWQSYRLCNSLSPEAPQLLPCQFMRSF